MQLEIHVGPTGERKRNRKKNRKRKWQVANANSRLNLFHAGETYARADGLLDLMDPVIDHALPFIIGSIWLIKWSFDSSQWLNCSPIKKRGSNLDLDGQDGSETNVKINYKNAEMVPFSHQIRSIEDPNLLKRSSNFIHNKRMTCLSLLKVC